MSARYLNRWMHSSYNQIHQQFVTEIDFYIKKMQPFNDASSTAPQYLRAACLKDSDFP